MISLIAVMGIMSTIQDIPAGLWALFGTIAGTVGLKVVEKWLNKNKEKNEVRRDLHQEIKDLIARVDVVEDEVSHWRRRAYDAEEQVALLRIMVLQLGGELPDETMRRIKNDADDPQKDA